MGSTGVLMSYTCAVIYRQGKKDWRYPSLALAVAGFPQPVSLFGCSVVFLVCQTCFVLWE